MLKVFTILLLVTIAAASPRVTRRYHDFMDAKFESGNRYKTFAATERWFNQKVDHYDPTNTATWKQRYYVNDTFFDGGNSPIFVILGGEGEEKPTAVQGKYIVNEYAQEFNALIVAVEHRFYGHSQPVDSYSNENMKRLLTSQQAEADYANFINYLIDTYGVSAEQSKTNFTKVVTFGGSYSGAVSAWMREKYPHLVSAAIASSGPVYAKENFNEYLEFVGSQVGKECFETIKEGTAYLEKMLSTRKGTEQLENDFNTCTSIKSEKDKQTFLEYVTDAHATFVQYNGDNNGMLPFGIDGMCSLLRSGNVSETYPRFIAEYRKTFGDSCTESSYEDYLSKMTSEVPSTDNARSWYWQTCAEFGYFQACSTSKCPFSRKYITLEYFEGICEDVFGVKGEAVKKAVDWTNMYYGGRNYGGTQTFFTNGDVDPWSELGITEETANPKLNPVEFISGTAHCADLYASDSSDLESLKHARARELAFLRTWLKY